ncbi:hypothetical protein [Saccharopolyspora oryzae]|uniref:Dehydratase n=1 Tax=Saccharopolyspora oryzae TaxID=2997343 RepID=A0ABT4USQ8_9PSEU|nr:hypothetical protein [Saccharopolyspora oryzae]MDA3624732.1 hypothetical protein [Saccharopolyspora oryzae]
MSASLTWGKRLAATAVAALAVAALPGTASAAAAQSIPFTCKTRLSGEWIDVTDYARGVDVTAPATAAPGESFDVVIDPQPIYPVPAFNKELRGVEWSYALPTNAGLDDHKLSGGSGLGDSKVTTSVEGSKLTVKISGPLPGGAEFDPPTLTLSFTAPRSGSVEVKPGGSSYDDLGFTWERLHPETGEWDPFLCFPDQAKPVVLSSTAVS